MSKEKFNRNKRNVNIGTSSRRPWQDDATAAITTCSRSRTGAGESYADIDNARKRRRARDDQRASRGVRDQNRHYARRLPGHADYIKKHDHRRGEMDGAISSSPRRRPMPRPQHILLAPGRRPLHRRLPQQVRHRRRQELLDLVELEVRELLTNTSSPAQDSIIKAARSKPSKATRASSASRPS